MAENLTPVQLEVGGFEVREVMLIDYKFNQEVDREGQIAFSAAEIVNDDRAVARQGVVNIVDQL